MALRAEKKVKVQTKKKAKMSEKKEKTVKCDTVNKKRISETREEVAFVSLQCIFLEELHLSS